MKVFLLDDPMKPGILAQFSHVGTWSEGSVCKSCGQHNQLLIEPLQIEWDPGTDEIGDFSWCGYTCVVLDPVKEWLIKESFECRFGPVEVMKPTDKSRRARVPYPYTGPHLNWLITTVRLPLDETRSGVNLKIDCKQCGQKDYGFKREGIVISSKVWSGEQIFRIDQFGKSSAKFVTEIALEKLNAQGFSNLCPRLAGEISD